MWCLSVVAFNVFISSVGLDVEKVGEYYVVKSNQPAYYVYEDEKFCLVRRKTNEVNDR